MLQKREKNESNKFNIYNEINNKSYIIRIFCQFFQGKKNGFYLFKLLI